MSVRRQSRLGLSGVAVVAVLAQTTWGVRRVHANPRPLPFTYVYETLGEGEAELEQYVDFTPVKAFSSSTGDPIGYGATQLQTEFEYGITNRLELGLYVTLVPQPGAAVTGTPTLIEGNGAKQRLRLRLGDEGELPIDIAFYAELVENDHEIEIEAKVILQKRFGDLRIVANLWAEREYYFFDQRDWVLNPTLGLTYQITPLFHPGVEAWLRVELPDPAPAQRPFNVGPHCFVGPTVMLSFGKLWWSTAAYLRVNERERSVRPGDAFGKLWLRTVVGVGL
jgi:hypothetical protein